MCRPQGRQERTIRPISENSYAFASLHIAPSVGIVVAGLTTLSSPTFARALSPEAQCCEGDREAASPPCAKRSAVIRTTKKPLPPLSRQAASRRAGKIARAAGIAAALAGFDGLARCKCGDGSITARIL